MAVELLLSKGFEFTRRRKKWIFLLAACGFVGFTGHRVYNFPCVAKKRERLLKLLNALISMAEAVSSSAETIGIVSKDLKEFLRSESDEIPNSVRQISKIMQSGEFSDSVIRVTRALTVGTLRGYRLEKARNGRGKSSDLLDKLMDKLFTTAGSGFASVIVGSFARNLVMALYPNRESRERSNLPDSANEETQTLVPGWINLVCEEKGKEFITDCMKLFVSTAVAVYLEKTRNINTYDEIFSGLTNPSHQEKVRDMLVSVCNGAVETLVKTSHQVLTRSDSKNNSESDAYSSSIPIQIPTGNARLGLDALSSALRPVMEEEGEEEGGWVSRVSSTLNVPGNRRFFLDVTGRVTFETVRSFLELLLEKLYEGLKRSLDVAHGAVVGAGLEIVKCMTAKSLVLATVWLSLCLHVIDTSYLLVPA